MGRICICGSVAGQPAAGLHYGRSGWSPGSMLSLGSICICNYVSYFGYLFFENIYISFYLSICLSHCLSTICNLRLKSIYPTHSEVSCRM